ncbi:hypothetical protein HY993_04860 [Candidatus Micrarchaeota archaeon]|nr:hypothetical protein [Candidatus Micrarchaeota archaeon]
MSFISLLWRKGLLKALKIANQGKERKMLSGGLPLTKETVVFSVFSLILSDFQEKNKFFGGLLEKSFLEGFIKPFCLGNAAEHGLGKKYNTPNAPIIENGKEKNENKALSAIGKNPVAAACHSKG